MTVVDTDFLIDLMMARPGAVAKLREMLETVEPLGLSTISLMQLHHGVARVGRPDRERERIRRALAGFTPYPLTPEVATLAGEWDGKLAAEGRRVDAADVIIAATAFHRREPVVTRNRRHFTRFNGVEVATYD